MEQGKGARALGYTLTAIGGLGIVAIFAPFYADVSPYTVLVDRYLRPELWPLAVPFLLPVPILLGSIRWLIAGRLSRRAVAGLDGAAVVSAGATLWWFADLVRMSLHFGVHEGSDRIDLFLLAAAVGVGFAITLFHVVRSGSRGFNSLVAAQSAFIANAIVCLQIAWRGVFLPNSSTTNWRIGAYLTIVVCAAYVIQVWLAFHRRTRQAEQAAGD